MKRHRYVMRILTLGLMLVFPCLSFSATDAGETVTMRGTVSDDYYAAAGTVNVDADIAGDLVVSGGDVFIGHRVQADVMALGGALKIGGEILDDVRLAGGDINIDATIGDDLFAAGGEITVSSATSIGGEVWLAGGDVHMAGTVDKGLFIGAGNIRISGTVRGDVELDGGDIKILEGAIIKGNLHYRSPTKAYIHPDVTITGTVSYEPMEWDHSHRGYGFLFSLTLIVAGMGLYLLFPRFTLSAAGRILTEPWKSLGVGFVSLVITPVTVILLLAIVLGVWVGLSLLALYFVALLAGMLVSCFFVGDWAARQLHKDVTTTGRRLVSVAIVIIVLGFIQLIPLIGGLLAFALLLLGLGAVILQLQFIYSQSA